MYVCMFDYSHIPSLYNACMHTQTHMYCIGISVYAHVYVRCSVFRPGLQGCFWKDSCVYLQMGVESEALIPRAGGRWVGRARAFVLLD